MLRSRAPCSTCYYNLLVSKLPDSFYYQSVQLYECKALKAINIDKARPLQMGLDRGKAAQCRKTASLKVESKKENSHADSSDNATR